MGALTELVAGMPKCLAGVHYSIPCAHRHPEIRQERERKEKSEREKREIEREREREKSHVLGLFGKI